MAGPIVRILVQAIVYGARYASTAFMQAYQQAAANPEGAKRAAAEAAKKATLRKGITIDEGLKILSFSELPKTSEELLTRYTKYFEANDPAKGGSFYLQSKFFRAKEIVEKQMAEESNIHGEKKTGESA